MKKIIYGLLITVSLIGSEVYAAETANPTAAHKPNPTVCPDVLEMKQLRKLEKGSIELETFKFTLQSPDQKAFNKMMPSRARPISGYTSKAHIVNRKYFPDAKEFGKERLTCSYRFRTAAGSVLNAESELFTIQSELYEAKLSLREQVLSVDVADKQSTASHGG